MLCRSFDGFVLGRSLEIDVTDWGIGAELQLGGLVLDHNTLGIL